MFSRTKRFIFPTALVLTGSLLALIWWARQADYDRPLRQIAPVSSLELPAPPADSLEKYRKNKIIPSDLATACLTALSHYPELKDTPIRFTYGTVKGATMHAQPELDFMFQERETRTYVIRISDNLPRERGIHVRDFPQHVLVGWFAHELGHIRDYMRRSNWDMVKFGIAYFFSGRFTAGAERTADLYAIAHGLGPAVLAVKEFILNHQRLSERYKAKIRRYYMSPQEILAILERRISLVSGA